MMMMMFLLTCDKKLTKSQLSPTHASTKRKITDELKHNAGWYEVREGLKVEVQWAVGGQEDDLWWEGFELNDDLASDSVLLLTLCALQIYVRYCIIIYNYYYFKAYYIDESAIMLY